MSDALLEVRGLKKHFPLTRGLFSSRVKGWIKAVDGVDFTIRRGETFALVGESGCGKTTTCRLMLHLEKPTGGVILMEDRDIASLDGPALKDYRTAVQTVFQDPYSSLDPRMRIEAIVAEPLRVQGLLSKPDIRGRVHFSLEKVGINPDMAQRYPHMFSGGQRQRIALARALAADPSLIVLDEPVSALDVSIRAQILNLLKELQDELGLAFLVIAHNLATVRFMSHWIGVMYLGRIVELTECKELFNNPLHPYTQALISASLPSHPDKIQEWIVLPGEVASAADLPPGCSFHPRCASMSESCDKQEVPLLPAGRNHWVRCHRLERAA